MNEVRHAPVDSVVMAVMAQGQSVVYVMPQFRVRLDGPDVVCHQPTAGPAVLALAAIAEKHGSLPRKILGAATPLVLAPVDAPGDAAASGTAIDLGTYALARTACELLTALLAFMCASIPAAGVRAVDHSTDLGGRALCFGSARYALNSHLFRLAERVAGAGAEALFPILRPTAVRLLGDRLAAGIARAQDVIATHMIDLSKPIDRRLI